MSWNSESITSYGGSVRDEGQVTVTNAGEIRFDVVCPRCDTLQEIVVTPQEVTSQYEVRRNCTNHAECGHELSQFILHCPDDEPAVDLVIKKEAGTVALRPDMLFAWYKGLSDVPLNTHVDYHCPLCGEVHRAPIDEVDFTEDAVYAQCRHPMAYFLLPLSLEPSTCHARYVG